MYKKASETGFSLRRGPLGNLESPLTRNFKIAAGLRKGRISLCGRSLGGLLSGDTEGYGEVDSVDGHHSPGGPCWGI